MVEFTWGDDAKIASTAPAELRPGSRVWVVGITQEPRRGSHFEQFPPGTVYLVEFGDGVAIDVHESFLETPE